MWTNRLEGFYKHSLTQHEVNKLLRLSQQVWHKETHILTVTKNVALLPLLLTEISRPGLQLKPLMEQAGWNCILTIHTSFTKSLSTTCFTPIGILTQTIGAHHQKPISRNVWPFKTMYKYQFTWGRKEQNLVEYFNWQLMDWINLIRSIILSAMQKETWWSWARTMPQHSQSLNWLS